MNEWRLVISEKHRFEYSNYLLESWPCLAKPLQVLLRRVIYPWSPTGFHILTIVPWISPSQMRINQCDKKKYKHSIEEWWLYNSAFLHIYACFSQSPPCNGKIHDLFTWVKHKKKGLVLETGLANVPCMNIPSIILKILNENQVETVLS